VNKAAKSSEELGFGEAAAANVFINQAAIFINFAGNNAMCKADNAGGNAAGANNFVAVSPGEAGAAVKKAAKFSEEL